MLYLRLLKNTRPGFHIDPLKFNKYHIDSRICIKENIERYLELTKNCRGDFKPLFLSLTTPNKPVTVSTIRRWITDTLKAAGIDIKIYTAHSTQHTICIY